MGADSEISPVRIAGASLVELFGNRSLAWAGAESAAAMHRAALVKEAVC